MQVSDEMPNTCQMPSLQSMQSGAGPHGGSKAASLAKRNYWDCISSSTDSLQAMTFDNSPSGGASAGGGAAAGASSGGAGLGGGGSSALFRTPEFKQRRGAGVAASFLSKLPSFFGDKKRSGAAATGLGLKQSASTESSLSGGLGGGPCRYQLKTWDTPHGSIVASSKSKREQLRHSPFAESLPAPLGSLDHLDVHPHALAPSPPPPAGCAPLRVVHGLGQGGFACVVQVERTEDGAAFAMKVVPKHKASRLRDRARLKVDTLGLGHSFNKKHLLMELVFLFCSECVCQANFFICVYFKF